MWKLSEHTQALLQQLHDLLSSTAWFAKAKREESILNLLDQIGVQEGPAAIPSVARCLFSTSQRVRITASRIVHRLLSGLSPDQFIQLSGRLGRSYGWYISDAWDKLLPVGISPLLVDPETQTAILGLLSFHRNGYVRVAIEEAVAEIHKEEGEEFFAKLKKWLQDT
jgi:hypothetical protein